MLDEEIIMNHGGDFHITKLEGLEKRVQQAISPSICIGNSKTRPGMYASNSRISKIVTRELPSMWILGPQIPPAKCVWVYMRED